LKSYLPPVLLGVFLNPDDIEQEIREQGVLEFSRYGVRTTAEETLSFFTRSSFLHSVGLADETRKLRFAAGSLDFRKSRLTFILRR